VTGQAASVALDIGTATIIVARDGAAPDISNVPDGGWPAALPAALARLGSRPRPDGLCLAVPDAWLDGSVAGTTTQEEARHLAADEYGAGPLRWAGQLAAVAALTARDRGPGRYLLCDVGASAVRVVSAEVDAPGGGAPLVVTTLAAHHADGGWREFDASLRARLSTDGRRLPTDWYKHATTEQETHRARVTLSRAFRDERFGDTRAYSIAGTDGGGIFAAELLDCFTAIGNALAAGIATVSRGRRPDVTVLTGGFGWFPLVAHAATEATGMAAATGNQGGPVVKPATGAAEGALLFASGQARESSQARLTVTMPVHRIYAGQLETADVPLEGTSPFADLAGGPLHLEGDDLMLTVNGSPTTVPLPGITPGPQLIGIRRGWTGATALVIRPVPDGTPLVAALTPEGPR
jgi:hypothetical protein